MFKAVILRPATQLTPHCFRLSTGGSARATPIVIAATAVNTRVLATMSGPPYYESEIWNRRMNRRSMPSLSVITQRPSNDRPHFAPSAMPPPAFNRVRNSRCGL